MPAERVLGAFLAMAWALSGCGAVHYKYHARRADQYLSQAQRLDAARLAPYPYQLAQLYRDKAREEAGHAAYQDAVALAREANAQALAAIYAANRADDASEKAP